MKKVSSIVLSLGLGSALAWLFVKSTRKTPIRRKKSVSVPFPASREEEIYGI